MNSPKYATRCVEQFLEYVKIDTQSNEDSDTFPSTPGQLVLLQRLHDELKALGLADVIDGVYTGASEIVKSGGLEKEVAQQKINYKFWYRSSISDPSA